ncbi:glycosyltransferase [Cellulomonas marina]|uniref:Glycosyltransferase, GT2 family n=1 Tax=Cellulomonas marina TaxID=988821 RepID=A0A1I0X5W0_9CELL|nr:glycosyltransferase [Cellulomonas marina]GIG28915.1 hypothetical protein Cma02nite_15150 [Cellulomonas marina]SFA95433.1 Glycosyltransferase, GT2 family [Cellulomonas marina]
MSVRTEVHPPGDREDEDRPHGGRDRGVAVVVVNYASSRLLEQHLAGSELAAVAGAVYVVDNRTTSAERAGLRGLAAREGWQVLEMDGNPGFGAGMNAGVRRATADGHDVFLLLNPDAWMGAADLHALERRVRADPMALLSPRIDKADGDLWFAGADLDLRTGHATIVRDGRTPAEPWLVGTALVVHRRLWEAVGGYDDDYFLYWEDVDLCWRVRRAGGTVAVLDEARAGHAVGGTQRGGASSSPAKSPTYYYWNCRNRLLFATQHLSRRTRLRWALTTGSYAVEVLLRGGRRQLLRPWRPVSAVVRGTLAGLVLVARSLRRPARGPGPAGRVLAASGAVTPPGSAPHATPDPAPTSAPASVPAPARARLDTAP